MSPVPRRAITAYAVVFVSEQEEVGRLLRSSGRPRRGLNASKAHPPSGHCSSTRNSRAAAGTSRAAASTARTPSAVSNTVSTVPSASDPRIDFTRFARPIHPVGRPAAANAMTTLACRPTPSTAPGTHLPVQVAEGPRMVPPPTPAAVSASTASAVEPTARERGERAVALLLRGEVAGCALRPIDGGRARGGDAPERDRDRDEGAHEHPLRGPAHEGSFPGVRAPISERPVRRGSRTRQSRRPLPVLGGSFSRASRRAAWLVQPFRMDLQLRDSAGLRPASPPRRSASAR